MIQSLLIKFSTGSRIFTKGNFVYNITYENLKKDTVVLACITVYNIVLNLKLNMNTGFVH